MSEVAVVRMQNPRAFSVEPLRDLFRKAFPGDDNVGPFEGNEQEFAALVQDDRIGVLVGVEDGDFRAVAVVGIPRSPLVPHPEVIKVYVGRPDRGGAGAPLRKALFQAIVDFIVQNGYTTFRSFCPATTQKELAAWRRFFRKGGEAKTVGSYEEFKIGS